MKIFNIRVVTSVHLKSASELTSVAGRIHTYRPQMRKRSKVGLKYYPCLLSHWKMTFHLIMGNVP
jgi:hypothetical protein